MSRDAFRTVAVEKELVQRIRELRPEYNLPLGISAAAQGERFGYDGVALGWRCVSPGRRDPFSVTQVCQMRHEHPTVIDIMGDFNDPNSWGCWD